MIAMSLRPSTSLALSSALTHLWVRLRCASLRIERPDDSGTRRHHSCDTPLARDETLQQVRIHNAVHNISDHAIRIDYVGHRKTEPRIGNLEL